MSNSMGSPGIDRIDDLLLSDERILTVSEVNRLARHKLETIFVTVRGEISRLATGYAYYVYFDLRDPDALLPAILSRQLLSRLEFELAEGTQVVVKGKLTLFEKQGKYQIRVEEIRPYGEGEIQRRIEALKKKLHAEGLFDDSRKKRLPRYPERIGVVTSPRGAAVRDVVVTLGRRFPPAQVYVRGVRVQGAGALEQICMALDFFDRTFPVDVVILARGGGSLQDLEPFNSEEVARAIAGMSVPVVTGIGHEPDVTIADLVADVRASTPTGAAEASVPDRKDVSASLRKSTLGLARRTGHLLEAYSMRLSALTSRQVMRRTEVLLGRFLERWERDAMNLRASPMRGVERSAQRITQALKAVPFRSPEMLYLRKIEAFEKAAFPLKQGVLKVMERNEARLRNAEARLRALDPLAVLKRGYSITYTGDRARIVRDSGEVKVGESVHIMLSKGRLDAEVFEKE